MAQNLPERLKFQPHLWWDPVPDWVLHVLPEETIREIARVQADFQVNVAQHQLEAAQRTAEVLKSAR
jgi:hypothetical protein